jgi:hypothetical protein
MRTFKGNAVPVCKEMQDIWVEHEPVSHGSLRVAIQAPSFIGHSPCRHCLLAGVGVLMYAFCWTVLLLVRFVPVIGRRHRHPRWDELTKRSGRGS